MGLFSRKTSFKADTRFFAQGPNGYVGGYKTTTHPYGPLHIILETMVADRAALQANEAPKADRCTKGQIYIRFDDLHTLWEKDHQQSAIDFIAALRDTLAVSRASDTSIPHEKWANHISGVEPIANPEMSPMSWKSVMVARPDGNVLREVKRVDRVYMTIDFEAKNAQALQEQMSKVYDVIMPVILAKDLNAGKAFGARARDAFAEEGLPRLPPRA